VWSTDLGSSKARWLAGAGILLAFWLLGPWVLVVTLLALFNERFRDFLAPRFKGRLALIAGVAVVVAALLIWQAPSGRFPIVSGPGVLLSQKYDGRPAAGGPDHSGGPVGEQPVVSSTSYGARQCGQLAFLNDGRLVGTCVSATGEQAVVINLRTMRPIAWRDLPERPSGGLNPFDNACAGTSFQLDDRDRMVVATAARKIQRLVPDQKMKVERSFDLTKKIAGKDCLTSVLIDGAGRIWFLTHGGQVGFVDPDSGRVASKQLQGKAESPLVMGETGLVHAQTGKSLHQLRATNAGVRVNWRRAEISGAPPAVLPGGSIAVTDTSGDRTRVIIIDSDDGRRICEQPVFESDSRTTHTTLTAVGDGVVVANNSGHAGPWRTLFGRSTTPGLARVVVRDGVCQTRWTNDSISVVGTPRVSTGNGLVYAVTKDHSWVGVDVWYLSAIDGNTGRQAYRVRLGVGPQFTSYRSTVFLGPDGTAYVPTISGIVTVRDRG
jgi:hypothetical protein